MTEPVECPPEVSRRLERLEREIRSMKRWARGSMIGLVLVTSCGAAIVAGERFTVRDSGGSSRATIGVHPDDVHNVYFSMSDDQQKQFLRMGNDPTNGSYLFILDGGGRKRVEFGVDAQKKAYLRFTDDQGRVIKELP